MTARRVLVLGLGITGEAVARRLGAAGDDVVVVEDSPGGDAYASRVSAVRARGVEVVERPSTGDLGPLLEACALLVPSPGVPERHPLIAAAQYAGVPVRPEIELAAERAAARGIGVVAVTGTNGKTTVTTLVESMLERSGVAALAAGNIGVALIDAVETDASVIVAEVSSFQLLFTSRAFRPRVAVLLNVAPDHLDWHGSFDRYAAAKAKIFANLEPGALLVFNADDDVVRKLTLDAPGRRAGFSTSRTEGSFRHVDGAFVDAHGREIATLPEYPLLPHDRANALAAAVAAFDVGATRVGVEAALHEFRRLPHRVAPVGEAGGVRYFDDSKATNPHATLAALGAFDEPVVLIAGGLNKSLDLSVLTDGAAHVRAVVAIGDAAGEIEEAFGESRPVVRASSMQEAVHAAALQAHPGDVVLLSPACASFDWYTSYGARGDDFAREVATLPQDGAPV